MFASMAVPAALGGLAGYFGTPDYSSVYGDYSKAMNALGAKYDPYIRGGAMAEKGLAGLNSYLMANPAGLENRLAGSFQNSNYQNQMQDQLRRQMNANAAETGMLGSTAQNAQLQNALANQQNQWMQDYINRGTQQFGMGYGGLQNLGMMLGQQGFNALGQQTDLGKEAALAAVKGGLSPTRYQNAMIDALGMGMGAGMGGSGGGMY